MRLARPIILVLAGALAAGVSTDGRAGDPEAYALDPVHTRVMIAIDHAGFSKAIGTVSGSTGTLVFDRDDWRSAQLDVRVPLARLDLGDAKWNAAALAANLLHGERHPEARFVSDTVQPGAADHARVCGQLTLRGVSRPLCLDVVLNALKRHPMPPFRRTAGFSATASLSRSDYGINAWKSLIGDQVEVRIEAEAVYNRRSGDAVDAIAPALEPSSPEPIPPGAAADPSAAPPPEPAPEPVPDPVPDSVP